MVVYQGGLIPIRTVDTSGYDTMISLASSLSNQTIRDLILLDTPLISVWKLYHWMILICVGIIYTSSTFFISLKNVRLFLSMDIRSTFSDGLCWVYVWMRFSISLHLI